MGEVLLDPGARYTQFVERAEVERLIRAGGSYRRSKLLSVLMLELWLSTYLPNATRPRVPAGTAR